MKILILVLALAITVLAHPGGHEAANKALVHLYKSDSAKDDKGPIDIGKLCLEQDGQGLRIRGELTLTGYEDGQYGFHIHQNPVKAGADCKDAGPHYNPSNKSHGDPNNPHDRHVGDLGNIMVKGGIAKIDILDTVARLDGQHTVIGKSFVVHKGKDDLGMGGDEESKKTGNAGARFACGEIIADHSGHKH